MNPLLADRRAGVLLHPTSLPGRGSAGTIGAEALRFVDFLAAGGFSLWQTLPLGPPDAYGSPYCSRSADAGDPGLIDEAQLAAEPALPPGMEFDAVREVPLAAWRSFCGSASVQQAAGFATFVRRERHWLLPHALFAICSQRFAERPWWRWPAAYRRRAWPALRKEFVRSREVWRAIAFQQYLFMLQWMSLKRHANGRGIRVLGDLPFYVDRNSADVWWNRALFRVDADGRPEAVAGVPPDYFSRDGQLWGNPLYDWEQMRADGYRWWLARVRVQLERFDWLRIDHFRALDSYWEVPASARTARSGQWREGPGAELLAALQQRFGALPLIAEDLGIITDAVRVLRDRFGLAGMLVLQFGFDGSADNPHAPANHREHAVVYTGTHDNDTTLGWYASLDQTTRRRVGEMLGTVGPSVADTLIDAAYASRARLAVIPMQDLMSLGSDARMNTPGTARGNWRWRFQWDALDPQLSTRSLKRAQQHDRLPPDG